jgi:hypothetical protein
MHDRDYIITDPELQAKREELCKQERVALGALAVSAAALGVKLGIDQAIGHDIDTNAVTVIAAGTTLASMIFAGMTQFRVRALDRKQQKASH